MREVHLRTVDLNLLHALHALLEERHVTRAAKRSFLMSPSTGPATRNIRRSSSCSDRTRLWEGAVRGSNILLAPSAKLQPGEL